MKKKYIAGLVAVPALALCLLASLDVKADGTKAQGTAVSGIYKKQAAGDGRSIQDKVQLLKDASASTSAMVLWKNDGSGTTASWLYNQEEEQEIVDYINGTHPGNAVKVDASSLKGNMYGIEIGRTDGTFTGFVWKDGYVFDNDGSVYKTDIDFDMIEKYQWQDKNKMSLSSFPNMYYIARHNGRWNKNYLEPGKKLQSSGLKLKLKEIKGNSLELRLKNTTKKTLSYGEYFSIQVKLGGRWYDIPAKEDLAFIDIAYILNAGKSVKKTYDISAYGELPAGKYRIVVEGACAGFNINAVK